jgi:hypothetical protein
MSNPTNNGTATYIDRSSKVSEFDFVIDKRMGEVFHYMPVEVSEINEDATIDVIPLLFKTTATGENQRRAPIYNVPVPEIRAGNMAIIAMPVVGQKGFVKIADRDISKIKRTLTYADVGSFRRHSFSESVWDVAGSCFNDTAEYKFQILAGGVINCTVTAFNITGDVTINGKVTQSGGDLKSNGVVLHTHTHGGVQSGTSNTSIPNV